MQPRRDRKPGLSAADHQHDRIAVGIFGGGFAQIEPVGPAKIARIGLAARPRRSELFLKTFQFIERRQQRPGLQRVVIAGIGDQPHDSAAAADSGFEFEHCLDRSGACARHHAGRGSVGVDRETCRLGTAGMRVQLRQDRVRAADGLEVPAQRQHVAPMAVGMKQGFEQPAAGFRQRGFELRQPVVRGYRDIIGPVQHSRSHTSRLRGVFLIEKPIPSEIMQKGATGALR